MKRVLAALLVLPSAAWAQSGPIPLLPPSIANPPPATAAPVQATPLAPPNAYGVPPSGSYPAPAPPRSYQPAYSQPAPAQPYYPQPAAPQPYYSQPGPGQPYYPRSAPPQPYYPQPPPPQPAASQPPYAQPASPQSATAQSPSGQASSAQSSSGQSAPAQPAPVSEPQAAIGAGLPPAAEQWPNQWVPQQTAVIQVLNKVDAVSQKLTVKVGQTADVGSLSIQVQACVVRPPDQPADAAAFLVISDGHKDEQGFQGWSLENEPWVSMLQNPVYNVRVMGCG